MTDSTKADKTPGGPVFRDLEADDKAPEISEIESLCLNCEEQGTTRLFLTKIPFFREIVVSSFSCEHCAFKDSQIMPAAVIQDKGVNYNVSVSSQEDMNRQVVQMKSATIRIPELDFEIPPNKGVLTTVEGVITRAIEGLQQEQPIRKALHPDDYEKIEVFLKSLEELRSGTKPFHLIVDDPSGNSFIENPHSPEKDPKLVVSYYERSKEQNSALGIQANDGDDTFIDTNARDEVSCFQAVCPNCNGSVETKMVLINIPHFKETLIMATVCEACGYKDNEVKGGGGIDPKGLRIKLKITNAEDLKRDVIKSETSSIQIPELDFDTEMGTMGGKFTTVEGLLAETKEKLQSNPFISGDSSDPDQKTKIAEFCQKLDQIIEGGLSAHLILDDPAGNSFVQSLSGAEPDSAMEVTRYERNFEQNELLGLNDMKTENYETS